MTTFSFLTDLTFDKFLGYAEYGFWAAVALGILILVHEYGHFIVARWVGVRVEKFSIGFGPRIAAFKRGDTEYMVSWIPLGGYVKFYGDDPEEGTEALDSDEGFLNQPPRKKLAIVAAGPIFNFVLAFVILFLAALYGVPTPSNTLASVKEGGPAAAAGMVAGDTIVGANGKTVDSVADLDAIIGGDATGPVTFTIASPSGEKREIGYAPETTGVIGIAWAGTNDKPIVALVLPGKPAEKAAFMIGDTIVAIDGTPVATTKDVVAKLAPASGVELTVTVLRDSGDTIPLKVTPVGHPDYGITLKTLNIQYGPIDAVGYGFTKSWEIIELTLWSLNKLISREVSHRQIAGPIGIMQMAASFAEKGLFSILFFVALISVNLGVLNLLPIPVLDGGHILFFSIEAILGRPVQLKVQEYAQQAGLFLLLSLMVLAFYNDIMRIVNN
jgi:regulator of sigma E protease